MNDIQNSLFETMKTFADWSNTVSNATTTIQCVITEVLDQGSGIYNVKYLDNIFPASANSNVTYSINDIVYVLIPDGNFENNKVILGLVNPTAVSYVAALSEDSKYYDVSGNLIDIDFGTIKMSSYDTINEKFGNISSQDLYDFNIMVSSYLETYNTFGLSFNVKTILPQEQQSNGNYGITINIPLILNADNSEVWVPLTLDVGSMLGNPYRITDWTKQSIYFSLDTQYRYNSEKMPTINYFCYGFNQNIDKIDDYDIFLKDITFSIYNKLTNEDFIGYKLLLKATQSECFTNNTSTVKKIIPSLKIDGKTTNIDNCEIYWFIENAKIKQGDANYCAEGGFGWSCLNEKTISIGSDDKEVYTYKTDMKELSVNKDDIRVSARYKCVVIYDKNRISSEITIKNLTCQDDIILFSSSDNNKYQKDIGNIELIVRTYIPGITDNLKYVDRVEYTWLRYDRYGNYINENQSIFKEEIHNQQIKIDDKIWYQEKISFPTYNIEDFNNIACSVTYKNNQEKEELIGTKYITISVGDDNDYSIVINNGNKLYKYDSDGDSPAGAAYDGPSISKVVSIEPISFTIRKPNGEEFTEEEYSFVKYKWSIPKNSLIELKNSYTREDDNYYYIEGIGTSSIIYNIAPRYNISKSNNTILLTTTFKGRVIEQNTTITFMKEGMSGSNGTSYAAQLVYGGKTPQTSYPYGAINNKGVAVKLKYFYNILEGKYYGYDYSKECLEEFNETSLRIYPRVFQNEKELNPSEYTITYTMFDEKVTNPCFEVENVDSLNGVILNYKENIDIDMNLSYCNILQAEIKISNQISVTNAEEILYCYYPIDFIIIEGKTELIPSIDGGFYEVMYASDGTNPSWDETTPFNFNFNSDIELKNTFIEWSSYNHIQGSIKDDNRFSYYASPDNKYDNGNSHNCVIAKVKINNDLEEREKIISDINILEDKISSLQKEILVINETESFLNKTAECFKTDSWKSLIKNCTKFLKQKKNIIQNDQAIFKTIEEMSNVINEIQNYKKINVFDLYPSIEENLNTIEFWLNSLKLKVIKLATSSDDTIEELQEYYKPILTAEVELKIKYTKEMNETLSQKIGKTLANSLSLVITSINSLLDLYQQDFKNLLYDDFENEIKIYNNIFKDVLNMYNTIPSNTDSRYLELKDRILQYNFLLSNQMSIESFNKIIDDFISSINNIISYSIENKKYEINNLLKDNFLKNIEKNTAEIKDIENKIKILNDILESFGIYFTYFRSIVIYFNRYEMSNLNGWDGNKLELGDGYLLAPQVGAGKKNDDNSFTGVVMGLKTISQSDYIATKDTKQVGLFAYSEGKRTFFLNAENGSAIFGKSGQGGQIIIDPGQDKALLYSSSYFKEYNNKTGLPSSYMSSNVNENGMLIDLDTPSIKWGNKNFEVNELGHLTAKGGGSIAGWEISDDKLVSGDKRTILYSKNVKTEQNPNDLIPEEELRFERININNKFILYHDGSFSAAGNGFTLDSIGGLTATSGSIAGWTIQKDYIASDYEYTKLYKNGKIECRELIANNLGEIAGWTINSNQLVSKDSKTILKSDGSIICNNFTANTSGYIAGWAISNNSLTGGNIIIDATGYIKAINGGWALNNDGSAVFTKVSIKGGTLDLGNGNAIINNDGSASFKNITINGGYLNIKDKAIIYSTGEAIFESVTINGGKFNIGSKFSVTPNGTLIASGAKITGEINATSGVIGGCTIEDGKMIVDGAQITGVLDISTIKTREQAEHGENVLTYNTRWLDSSFVTDIHDEPVTINYVSGIELNENGTVKRVYTNTANVRSVGEITKYNYNFLTGTLASN